MTPKSWLDIMPPIPLARGVPVAAYVGEAVWRGVCAELLPPSAVAVIPDGVQCTVGVSSKWVKVDLDDPQGVAYALRWLAGTSAGYDEAMLSLWVRGDTRDEDCLALARTCAEVVERKDHCVSENKELKP